MTWRSRVHAHVGAQSHRQQAERLERQRNTLAKRHHLLPVDNVDPICKQDPAAVIRSRMFSEHGR